MAEHGDLFGEDGEPLDDICRNKHGGNLESESANQKIEPSKSETRRKIFLFALQRGARGITADEVAAAWDTSHNHVAPRISELKRDGLLIPTIERRLTRSGCSARVLVAMKVGAGAGVEPA